VRSGLNNEGNSVRVENYVMQHYIPRL